MAPLTEAPRSETELINTWRGPYLQALDERNSAKEAAKDANFALYDALLVLWQLAQSVSCMVAEGPDVLKTREVYANVLGDVKKALAFIAAKYPEFKPPDTNTQTCSSCKHNQLPRHLEPCVKCNKHSSVDPFNLWEASE